jgi:hypothetical protein
VADVDADPIPLDDYAVLVELRIATGERRAILDGERYFAEGTEGIARIGSTDVNGWTEKVLPGARRDSMVELCLPSVELDSDSVFRLSLWFYTGPNPLVLLHGEALPKVTLEYVLAVVESALKEADWSKGRYLDLAEEVQNMGLWILHRRTREIEQSVRDALDDENFSPADYAALRDYPARLARVEAAAGKVNSIGRESRLARTEGGPGGLSPDPPVST